MDFTLIASFMILLNFSSFETCFTSLSIFFLFSGIFKKLLPSSLLGSSENRKLTIPAKRAAA
jgi:hypothetical protein